MARASTTNFEIKKGAHFREPPSIIGVVQCTTMD